MRLCFYQACCRDRLSKAASHYGSFYPYGSPQANQYFPLPVSGASCSCNDPAWVWSSTNQVGNQWVLLTPYTLPSHANSCVSLEMNQGWNLLRNKRQLMSSQVYCKTPSYTYTAVRRCLSAKLAQALCTGFHQGVPPQEAVNWICKMTLFLQNGSHLPFQAIDIYVNVNISEILFAKCPTFFKTCRVVGKLVQEKLYHISFQNVFGAMNLAPYMQEHVHQHRLMVSITSNAIEVHG